MTDLTLILAPYALASCWWIIRHQPEPARRVLLVLFTGLLLAAPWLPTVQESHPLSRAILTLVCVAVLAPKLLDAHLSPSTWHARQFKDWLAFLINPYVLVRRAHQRDPGAPRADNLRHIARGFVSIAAGGATLSAAFAHDFSSQSFWVEHTVKALGCYLLFFDGQFVLATGTMRLLTGRALEFSQTPILAHSPANFWRRYNRDAGRFLAMDILDPLVARRRVFKRALVVFLISGAIHEYLAWTLTGRLTGHQTLFFALQGLATVLTFSWHPNNPGLRIVGIAATIVFNLVTSALFFASVDLFTGWYDTQSPLAWH